MLRISQVFPRATIILSTSIVACTATPEASRCAAANGCNESPALPGAPVQLALRASDQAALTELDDKLAELSSATSDSLLSAHPVQFQADLGYDPNTAAGLELIQATGLALTPDELAKLGEHGFVISAHQTFANMAMGLNTIYAHDLPLYISIDPILDAVHNAYDGMLKVIETDLLTRSLASVLDGARERNRTQTSDAEVRRDLDFYFSVALSLLRGQVVSPVAGADPTLVATFVSKAAAAEGIERLALFGVPREIDFSQFKPRGHYTDSVELTRYFQATMWLGRTDFRLIETQTDGSRVFHRRQLNAVLALRDATSDVMESYDQIDAVVSAFVGEHDYMQLHEVDQLLTDLGVSDTSAVADLPDQTIAQTIIDRGYGAQRIMSQVIFKDPSTLSATLPLDRSFAFLGQRYVVDSHVFSEVVYDRVLPGPGEQPRYLPDPLDAAYAAFGNSAALPLLREGLDRHGYAPQLERVRIVIDENEPEYWQQNLYNLWLSSLRALSPTAAADEKLPSVARSEAWSRRVLNTQLGSWAQLRHDTILYAKQSYTSGNSCEFPDAYVDPYPEAFARLTMFAQKGKGLVALLGRSQSSALGQRLIAYFNELESVSSILRDMAEQQQKGVPFNEAQMAFVNDAVKSRSIGCGGPFSYTGWYARLMFGKDDSEMDPTIADVHTDPGGTRPAKVLHVATGLPRLMVVTANTCNGPRAYAGLSFAYHEVISEGLVRLNDQEWAPLARTASFAPWLEPVLGR